MPVPEFLQCRQPYFLFQHRHQLTPVIFPLYAVFSSCRICKTSLSQAFLSVFSYSWCLYNYAFYTRCKILL